MFDDPDDPDGLPDLSPPQPPTGWRERLEELAERLDLTPARLLLGLVVLAALGIAGWRLLAPPEPPAEMTLPMIEGVADAGVGDAADAEATGPQTPGPARVADSGVGLTPEGEPSEVVVHVAGAVTAPGVQRLAAGARVVDALDAAGGSAADADLARLNLAAVLVDAEHIYVPRVGEDPPPLVATAGGSAGGEDDGDVVSVNQASASELEGLPGIGPVLAEAIVAHREQNGPFTDLDQLIEVRGIGEAKLEALRDAASL